MEGGEGGGRDERGVCVAVRKVDKLAYREMLAVEQGRYTCTGVITLHKRVINLIITLKTLPEQATIIQYQHGID